MKTSDNKYIVRKSLLLDEDTNSALLHLAKERGIKESHLIRVFIQEGLARTLPSLGNTPIFSGGVK